MDDTYRERLLEAQERRKATEARLIEREVNRLLKWLLVEWNLYDVEVWTKWESNDNIL